MSSHRSLLTLLAVLTWGDALACAQEPTPAANPPLVQIRLSVPAPATIHAFGGRPLAFDLIVQAPLGTRTKIYADVLQTAQGAVAATLQRDVLVSAELAFDDCTSLTVPCRLPALEAVKRTASMRLRLRTDPQEGKLADPLLLPMTVYSAEEPDTWKKTLAARLTQSGLRRLAVFGEGKGARQFFRIRNVAFEDLGSDWPTTPEADTLYIADLVASATISRRPGEVRGIHWLIFTPVETTPLPPGVYQRVDASGGGVCKVTLPGLFDHPEDHPEKLACLAEIFRLALEPRPVSANESSP